MSSACRRGLRSARSWPRSRRSALRVRCAAERRHLNSDDVVRSRFGQTAEGMAARQDRESEALAERVRTFVQPRGDERALDVGAGAGAFALALAPLVREVTATDIVPELLEEARRRAPENMTVLEADATDLPFPDNSFDL